MREFFRGWKRKFGVFALVIACVLTAGWVRNHFIQDSFSIPTGDSSAIELISGCHCLTVTAVQSSGREKQMSSFRVYHRKLSDDIEIHIGDVTRDSSPAEAS